MKIGIICNPVFDGWSPLDTRLGGSEESIVQWAEWMVRLGHQVSVYGVKDLTLNGVEYYQNFYTGSDEVVLNIKSPDMPGNWIFTNDTDANRQDLSKFKGVIWPSHWAKDNIPVNNPNVKVVYHGYDPERIYPSKKIKNQVLYASSPDRGLDTLLAVWPEVRRRVPGATLVVTYGAAARDVDGVMFVGDLTNDEMDEMYRTSDIWCHPANGGELFGITGIKAQAAGCVPVYFPTMALGETVLSGVMTEPAMLEDDLVRVMESDSLKAAIREELATKHFVTWEESTKQLLEVITS